MATVLHTSPDKDMAAAYLSAALKTHKQAEIARHLGVGARTEKLTVKARSKFRMSVKHLAELYKNFEPVKF